jgi:hypothetical protein
MYGPHEIRMVEVHMWIEHGMRVSYLVSRLIRILIVCLLGNQVSTHTV